MSYGWQVLIRSVVKQRKLERSIDYSRLSESDGKKLIQGFKGVEAFTIDGKVMAQQLSILFQSRSIPAKTRTFLDYFQSKLGCLTTT